MKNRVAGRPKKRDEPTAFHYFVTSTVTKDDDTVNTRLNDKSCYVIGTNIDQAMLSAAEVMLIKNKISASRVTVFVLLYVLSFTRSLF